MRSALTLVTKQTSILIKTFTSYQQLRSLILSQDLQGFHSSFLRDCDAKLLDVGLYANTGEHSALRREYQKMRSQLENSRQNHRAELENAQKRHKDLLAHCTRGIKDYKQHIEESQKQSIQYLTNIVKGLVDRKHEESIFNL